MQPNNPPTTDNGAVLHGYTRELLASADGCDLHISVKPDANLDDCFVAFCHDEQEIIRVNGWLFTFEDINSTDHCEECARMYSGARP